MDRTPRLHTVTVTGRRWTLSHPIEEHQHDRVRDCALIPLVATAMEQRAMFDGDHHVWVDRTVLQWEEINREEHHGR